MLPILTVVLCLILPMGAQAALTNELRDHPSPYLALHGGDPVQWQSWSRQVLEQARAEDKLIFISSGYFACHWCHVMQQESYRDPEVAALLNRHFIPVKVDRELQPALDAHLIDFVQRTRGQAGWPLNVFLTPEGYPVFGMTYAPKASFLQLLGRLEKIWAAQREELRVTARQASLAVEGSEKQRLEPATPLDRPTLESALFAMAINLGDDMEGGFGHQSRFPMSPQWTVLLERVSPTPGNPLRDLIELTLNQMANQGMRDHIGGGFFRYTVDPGWQLPHFEKMLYNQALLSRLYLRAAAILNRPDYLEVARDTLDFTLRVLKGSGGGFIASLSAVDPENREGGGYLWDTRQLEQVLDGDELAFARKRWRLAGTPVSQGAYLPVNERSAEQVARDAGWDPGYAEDLEQRVRQKLLAARTPRNHPRDEKQLAAWNGLMLSALVDGARVLKQARYLEAASDLRDYLVDHLWDGNRLVRARGPKGPLGRAALEDYVYVAAGLYDWAVFSGSRADRQLAGVLARQAWARFHDGQGWRHSDDALLPGIAHEAVISDGPLPSPAALLIRLSLQLDDPRLKAMALRALEDGHKILLEQPIWYATRVQLLLETPAPSNRP